jgi:hypothetical protein
MTSNGSKSAASALDRGTARIPTCALDRDGVNAQSARYARLGADVERLEREPDSVLIEFGEGFDRELVAEALAVERACCPFLAFDFDERTRRLRTTVRERAQLPALDAIAVALGAARRHDARG